jgi:RND superfamily putative drug exporter
VWQRSIKPPEDGYWRRTAIRVMRHPLVYATATIAFLVFLASPFLGIHLGYLDDKVLPLSNPVRQTDDTLRQEFSSGQAGAIQVVVPAFIKGQALAVTAETYRYAQSLSELPKVLRVESALGFFIKGQHVAVPTSYAAQYREPRGTWLSVVPTVDPLSVQAESVVTEVRTAPSPYPVQIGGLSAQFLDSTTLIEARMPLAFGLIGLAMFVLLFVLFGSIVIPIKAMVLNVFSLAATFGAMVWIFQDGHLSGLLDFTATGSVIAAIPVMMFCVAFGLSMDYEVFLISRIKEQHDLGESNEDAVATGLQRSGRIITAAALLLAVVFLTLTTNQISGIKLFGVGLFLAVLVDAFLIRGVLVPAFMKAMGDLNWWAPAPLKRWHLLRNLAPDRNDHPDRYPRVETLAGASLGEASL